MTRGLTYIALASVLILSGCTVGPNYSRPPVNVPPSYRNQTPEAQANESTVKSLGDEKWWTVFKDPELEKLIRQAQQSNYNAQIAASRILQSQQELTITRADQFPTVNGTLEFQGQKVPGFAFKYYSLGGALNWDPDFWGRYRRATEAARANILAAEWNRQEVLLTLFSNVASAYFQLRELDLELEISKRALESRKQSLQLTETLLNGGSVGLLDVRQAEQLVETAAAQIPATEQAIGQTEDLISTLIGDNPHDIPRGKQLVEEELPSDIPAGLPSRLLERRPDIRQSEQQLVAANAQIGVARAQLFPSLPLTGSAGLVNSALGSLFVGGGTGWTAAAPLTQPIFEAGRLRANVRLTEAEQQQAVLQYKQTIQQAFQQVADSLIAFRKYREYREHEQVLEDAAKSASDLSHLRYNAGATSYLEVLTNETNYFASELNVARAQLNERLSLVQVYTALGGGWVM